MIFYLVFIFICCVCGGEALAWRVCAGQRTVGGAYSCLFPVGHQALWGLRSSALLSHASGPLLTFFKEKDS